MTLADSAIVGIVALLVMCIPGVQYLSRVIRRRLHSRRYQTPENNTLLPLSERFIDACSPPPRGIPEEAPGNLYFTSLQGFVCNSLTFCPLRMIC